MSKSKAKYARLADAQKRKARQYYRFYTKYEDDGGMLEMFKTDYKDMKRIASLIRKGQITKACDVFENLDTVAREEGVANSVWNFLYAFEG